MWLVRSAAKRGTAGSRVALLCAAEGNWCGWRGAARCVAERLVAERRGEFVGPVRCPAERVGAVRGGKKRSATMKLMGGWCGAMRREASSRDA